MPRTRDHVAKSPSRIRESLNSALSSKFFFAFSSFLSANPNRERKESGSFPFEWPGVLFYHLGGIWSTLFPSSPLFAFHSTSERYDWGPSISLDTSDNLSIHRGMLRYRRPINNPNIDRASDLSEVRCWKTGHYLVLGCHGIFFQAKEVVPFIFFFDIEPQSH